MTLYGGDGVADFGRDYTSTATAEDVFKIDVFHIYRGWIIANTLVSKR